MVTTFSRMHNFLKTTNGHFIRLIPLALCLVYLFIKSQQFPLHDFANSYFPAHIAHHHQTPEVTLFDVYEYNKYIWNLGYEEVLADFYLNSPFNATFFYPFSLIENAYTAKLIFNALCIVFFLSALYVLSRRFSGKTKWFLAIIPILCFVPLRNQVLFAQTYFLVFALVVFSYILFEKRKNSLGAGLLVTAALIKVFPIAYSLPLVFKKQWKAILVATVLGVALLLVSVLISGASLWETYLFEVIPNAIKNKSTVNFQYNAQSMDVFLKTLLVKDAYYNPGAIFDNEQLFYAFKWVFKSVILGSAISFSLSKKDDHFALLSIWVVTLFLLQSRTATYTQILWLIPTFYMMSLPISTLKKVAFLSVLFLVCNIPISSLEVLPLVFKFSRLWLSLLLAALFYVSLNQKINYKLIAIGFLLLLPLHLNLFSKPETSNSKYVLDEQTHFMVFDFNVENNQLVYNALGKNGNEFVLTDINIADFNKAVCRIIDNQIVMKGQQLTDSPDLKKKPVLVNDCEVFYLSDWRSRRGAFTIKKLNICGD